MQYNNLIEVLKKSAKGRAGITFIEGGGPETFLSYHELYACALRTLFLLQEKGIRSGDEVVFQVEDNRTFIIYFWACVLGGIIPVPLTIGKTEDHRQKLFNVWGQLSRPHLVISRENFENVAAFAAAKGLPEIYAVMKENMIDDSIQPNPGSSGKIFHAKPGDIVFIQFSSGSTGSPKGVVLTHKNLITNIRAISKAARYATGESMISWMPLTHDMGLIGFHLNPTFCGMDHYLMPPGLFIRRPALWLDKVTEHKINILSCPNFGYEYLLKHCDPLSGTYGWDLSSVRLLYNGAEPISERLCRRFLEALKKYKLKSRAMCPVYGLAEASLAVSISGLRDEVSAVFLDRNSLNRGDSITILPEGKNAVSFVNVGRPVNDCMLLIANDEDQAVAAGVIGQVLIKGDNVTSGYYHNKKETEKAMSPEGWLRTGDLGFQMDGKLYITGRAKDIVFINGQNYYPHDIERTAEEVPGVELNKIAAAGFFNTALQKEEIIVFLLHRGDIADFIPMARSVRAHINGHTGILVDRIIPVRDMPRTTSGKLQRFILLDQFKKGHFKNIDETVQSLLQKTDSSTDAAVMPKGSYEQGLLSIWRELCKNESIGVTDRFFEIGGTSLKAAQATMMVWKEFQVDLPVETIYKQQTVRELAAEMERLHRKDYRPVPSAAPADYYPATSAQERLYYIWAADKTSIAYNIPLVFAITGTVVAERLESCLLQLIHRHDSLRSSFRMVGRKPGLLVEKALTFKLESITCNREEIDLSFPGLVRPFDLSEAPLFRCVLLNTSKTEHFLFLDFHHIISDGVSMDLFIEELQRLYTGHDLAPLPVEYKDYAIWEKDSISPERMQQLKDYWKGLLVDRPVLEMPLDFPRPIVPGMKGAKIGNAIDRRLTTELKFLAQANGATIHALMFTLYYVLLLKYTGQQDIVIGIPVAGRVHPDVQQLQGMFVNNLAIRVDEKENESFIQLLKRVNEIIQGALQHQDMPFAALILLLQEKRDIGRNPLFDTMLVYQNMGYLRTQHTDLVLREYFFDPGVSKFDISMEIIEEHDTMRYNIEYSTELFEKNTVMRLAGHFDNVLDRLLHDPHIKISDIQPMTENEYDVIIRQFNATETAYPRDKTIHQLFDAQVVLNPDKIAIEYGTEKMTFSELDERSNRLAVLLRQKGVVPNISVAVLLHRSPALIISILAVLKAGGCYLPIEPGLPAERIKYLADNSQCRLLIASGRTMAGLPHKNDFHAEVINYDKTDLSTPDGGLVEYISNPHNLAYVMYTSGTTGHPKGVMIEHTSLVNYVIWASEVYIKNEPVSFPLHTSIAFDLTVTSIFTPLITGNKIVIYDDHQQELLIQRIVTDNRVDIVKLTPSHLRLLLDSSFHMPPTGSRIRRFIIGGEKLDTSLAETIWQLFEGQVEIYNEYGPTETTVGCMIYKFEAGSRCSSVPIGIPAANTRIYLLDKFLHPVVTGVKGEIYISGDGIARGYIFNGEMTSRKFIPDPFAEGRKMYKTGDLARRLADGNIEYIGRYDQQVKINGYRIELSDIETHIKSYEGISEALVTVKANLKGKDSLYAYYIPEYPGTNGIDPADVRNYLAGRLPHYMIPVQFIAIDNIPLTRNGKVDYDALPAVSPREANGGHPGALNDIEVLSLQVWEEVLGTTGLTVLDNFFELGGDSISAVRIASGLGAKGIVISVKNILTYHTIRQISIHALLVKEKNIYEQGILEGEKGLTPIESWFFNQGFENEHYFNQSVLLEFPGIIHRGLLEKALTMLIAHHDGLRMNYDREKNVLFYNNKHLNQPFIVEETAVVTDGDPSSGFEEICRKIKSSFDISNGLLLKAAIIKEIRSPDRLLLTAHHLVMDGVSWRILLEDLYMVYRTLENGKPVNLPPKTAALTDWERGLRTFGMTEKINEEAVYWGEIENTTFRIPLDVHTDDWKAKNTEIVSRTLDRDKTEFLLKDAHQVYRTDVPILLQTAMVIVLREWTGIRTFIIQQENHGRYLDDMDTSRTTGWCTTMFPAKLTCIEGDIGQQIKHVKEQIRSIPNKGMGYGICKYMLDPYQRRKEELPEIMFNYLGQFGKELDNDLFSYSPAPNGSETDPSNKLVAKLDINCMVVGGRLNIEIKYNRCAHQAATINWLMDGLFKNIDLVLDNIRGQSSIHFTPSDFSAAHLDQEELDALFN